MPPATMNETVSGMVQKRLWRRPVVRGWLVGAQTFACLLLAACLGTPCSAAEPAIAPSPADIRPSAAYLLMIDRSGSMLTKDQPRGNLPNATTRWEAAKQRVKEFVSSAPLGSEILIAPFSDQPVNIVRHAFQTERDRQQLLKWIDEYPDPKQEGTHLYATLAKFLDLAKRISAEHRNRYISVLIFSDGKDETSPPPWTKEKLQEDFDDAVSKNDNLWVFIAPIGPEGATPEHLVNGPQVQATTFQKHPLSIERLPATPVRLKNARISPRQTLQLEFVATGDTWKRLDGQAVSFDFVADPGQNIRVKTTARAPLRKGPIPIEVEVENPKDLQGEQEYSGKLRIHYPVLEKYVIPAADFVQVSFQKGESPVIYWRIPEDGLRFAAGQPIQFKVSTLQGADVTWDFGDGQTATGADVRHEYGTAGARKGKVKVQGDPSIRPTTQEFSLEIIDVGVSVNPIHEIVVEGLPHRFRCLGRGDVKRFEWQIDGNIFEGRPCGDPAEGHSEIIYTFHAPGLHEVSVVGLAQGAKPSSKRVVEVKARPAVVVTGGLTRPFRQAVEFKLEAPDGWERIEWFFGDDGEGEAGNPNPVHRYRQYGAFDVQAKLTWKGDRQVETKPLTVNVVAERPQARPRVMLAGKPVERVVAGATVELVDESTGDVIRHRWSCDGQELPSSQVTLPLLETGVHEIALRVEGPPDRQGRVGKDMEDSGTVPVNVVPPPDHYKFAVSLFGALIAVCASGWWLFGNAPRQWRVYASNRGIPNEETDLCVRVVDWWDSWRKHAVIPMRRLFPGCEHWSTGEGAGQAVTITAMRQGGRLEGTASYSGDTDDRVVSVFSRGDAAKTDYQWTDNRCTSANAEDKQLYLRLVKTYKESLWPLAALSGIVLALTATVWMVFHMVYQGNF